MLLGLLYALFLSLHVCARAPACVCVWGQEKEGAREREREIQVVGLVIDYLAEYC